MSLKDTLINQRENILNWMLNNDPGKSLNQDHCSPDEVGLREVGLAEDIKDALNKIKSLAISSDGSHVNYQALSQDPAYNTYRDLVCDLKYFDYQVLKDTDQQLAFWINLYNALVIDSVIQNHIDTSVIESRLGILSFFQNNAYTVNGQRFSLTDIEHGVLRANQGFPYFPGKHFSNSDTRIKAVLPNLDPRIHFSLNCASLSCPPIGIYTAENIQDQLDLAASNFINNDIQVYPDKREISISRIFRWYLADFGGTEQLPGFIAEFISDKENGKWLLENKRSIKIVFHAYDWKLNKIS